MSIVSWKKLPGSDVNHENNEVFEYEYSVIVVTDTVTDTTGSVMSNSRMPKIGASYPGNGAAKLYDREVRKIDERVFVAKLMYSTPTGDGTKPPGGNKPNKGGRFIFDPSISRSERTIEVYDSLADFKKKPYVNTIGQLLAPPPPKLKSIGIITIVTAQLSYSEVVASALANKVNTDYFIGFSPMTLLAKKPTSIMKTYRPNQDSDVGMFDYDEITYTFEHDPEGWIPTKVLNVGTLCKHSNAQSPENPYLDVIGLPRDELGREYEGEVLLDARGLQISPADIASGKKKPHVLDFTQYETISFGRTIGI